MSDRREKKAKHLPARTPFFCLQTLFFFSQIRQDDLFALAKKMPMTEGEEREREGKKKKHKQTRQHRWRAWGKRKKLTGRPLAPPKKPLDGVGVGAGYGHARDDAHDGRKVDVSDGDAQDGRGKGAVCDDACHVRKDRRHTILVAARADADPTRRSVFRLDQAAGRRLAIG